MKRTKKGRGRGRGKENMIRGNLLSAAQGVAELMKDENI